METWGELFWDAWIRFRLWCRSLIRTCWPVRFKAWQVCTATGIVSVILTLIALNYQSGTAKDPGTNLKSAANDTLLASKPSGKKSLAAAPLEDPFAEMELAANPAPVQDLGAQNVPDSAALEPEFASPIKEIDSSDVATLEENPLAQPMQMTSDLRDLLPPAVPSNAEVARIPEPPADNAEAVTSVPVPAKSNASNLFQDPEPGTTEPGTTEPEQPVAATADESAPAVLPPQRGGKHHARLGNHEDSEEDRHSVREIRVPLPPEVPAVARHAPLSTPIRSNSHYSRFGKLEDSEEERHSVREIRPTRIDVVLIPKSQAPAPAPATSTEKPPQLEEQPVDPLPTPEPVAAKSPEPETEVQRPVLPPIDATEVTGSDEKLFGIESSQSPPVQSPPVAAEQAEETLPPVLFAPEPEDVPYIPTPAARPQPMAVERHGPIRSTKPGDHAAHQDEDKFERPTRRVPVITDAPASDTVPTETPPDESPVEAQTAPPTVPARSTKATDHEAHQKEDNYERPTRRAPVIRSSPAVDPVPLDVIKHESPDQAAGDGDLPAARSRSTQATDHAAHADEDNISLTPRKAPVVADIPQQRPEPVAEEEVSTVTELRKLIEKETLPRTVPRNSPRIIHEYDEVVDEQITPMAVTQPRGPERITIPDGMQPEPPTAPDRPLSRRSTPTYDSEGVSVVPKRAAPRLVMEITGPRQAPVGTQIVMHFKITNAGSVPASQIVVSDVLPAGLQHALSPDLEYTIARLEPGETRETNLTVKCTSRGTITNRAVLKADGDVTTEAEFQLEVTSWSTGGLAQGKAVQSPLTVSHHGPEHWLVDSTGQFLVTVTNTSRERQRNVTILHAYPKGTELVHATVGHKVDAANRTVTWTIADFAPGASYILETELHSLTSGPGTSIVRVKVGDAEVAEDSWTAISDGPVIRR